TLLTTIPPVYYPLSYIPLPFRYLAFISPTTYATLIAQNSAGFAHLSESTLIMYWLILIAITLIFAYLAMRRSRWRDV
ncbi:ABC-2 type transporter, partial [mine drainage metagenome]